MLNTFSINIINTYNITPYPQEFLKLNAPNDIIMWELIGDDSENFIINNDNILSYLHLDEYNKMNYFFQVKATDNNNNYSITTIKINITSLEDLLLELPLKGNNVFYFNFNMLDNLVNLSYQYPDILLEIKGSDKNIFTIENNKLKFILLPTLVDLNLNPTYNITLEASAANYNLSLSITLSYMNVNNLSDNILTLPKNINTIMENQLQAIKLVSDSNILIEGDDKNRFYIEDNIINLLERPNYEKPIDDNKDNSYHIIIKAIDDKESKINVIIFIDNIINEPNELTIPNYNLGVYQTQSDIVKIKTEAPYNITIVGDDVNYFNITSDNVLKLNNSYYNSNPGSNNIKNIMLEFEGNLILVARLNIKVEIILVDDELPIITNIDNSIINTPENEKRVFSFKPNKQVSWYLDGIDRDLFNIAGGELSFKIIPDYENIIKRVFDVSVGIIDQYFQSKVYPLTINLLDADETIPEIILEKEYFKIYENETFITKLISNRHVVWSFETDDYINLKFYFGLLELKEPITFNKRDISKNIFQIKIMVKNKYMLTNSRIIIVEILPLKTMLSFGDPHIITLNNELYELPKKVACYRMIQGPKLFINIKTRKLYPNEKIIISKLGKHLVNDGVFYHKIYIYSENYEFIYDFDSTAYTTNNNNYFKFIDKKIKFKNKSNGSFTIEIIKSKNPQNKHNFKLSLKGKSSNLDGLLITEYYAPSMSLLGLKDTTKKKGSFTYNPVFSKLIN